MAEKVRLSLCFPQSVVDDLVFVSKFAGVSRSSLVSLLLTEALGPMRALCEVAAENGVSPEERARRMRGVSVDLVEDRVRSLQDALGNMDSSVLSLRS